MIQEVLISLVGAYGSIGLIAVMIFQTIVAFIPSEAVLVFAGAIMNIFDVILYGGTGLILGSVIAFFIARYGGRPVVVKFIGEKWIDKIDRWIAKHGAKAILLSRVVPVIPFDLISYVSGITKLKFRSYFFATLIGAFPRCLFLAYAGSIAGGVLASLGVSLEIFFLIGVIGVVALMFMERKGYIDELKDIIIDKIMKKFWK